MGAQGLADDFSWGALGWLLPDSGSMGLWDEGIDKCLHTPGFQKVSLGQEMQGLASGCPL